VVAQCVRNMLLTISGAVISVCLIIRCYPLSNSELVDYIRLVWRNYSELSVLDVVI
jgi:hypothetical protein